MRIYACGVGLFLSACVLGSFGAEAGTLGAAADGATTLSGTQTAPVSVPVPTPSAGAGITLTTWAGYSASNGWQGAYVGGIVPLNKQQGLDGVLVRADGLFGTADFNISTGDVMIGYGADVGSGWISGFVGPDVESDDAHGTGPHGTKWGVKGAVEYDTPLSDRFRFSGLVSYATPYSNTFALARVGYLVGGNVHIGPEASGIWRDSYHEHDFGAFIDFDTAWGGLSLSGGYSDPQGFGGRSGYYVGVDWGFAIH